MLFVSLFDCLSVFLCQLNYTSIFESRRLITPLLSSNLFTRYQVCTICFHKEDELCLNNSEYIAIYMQYTNTYMCKLNFYKCWNICVDHCHLLPTVYKVKIEIDKTNEAQLSDFTYLQPVTDWGTTWLLTWFQDTGIAIIKRTNLNSKNIILVME